MGTRMSNAETMTLQRTSESAAVTKWMSTARRTSDQRAERTTAQTWAKSIFETR